MSEAKHTPGPWELQKRPFHCTEIIADVQVIEGVKTWASICEVSDEDVESEANARLISVVPDLYELARMYLEWAAPLIKDPGMVAMERIARAAIAKALGEPSHG